MDGPQLGPSLIKQLGSSDSKTRNKSLRLLLNSWLPSQNQVSDEDMRKIWKGLFYCVWHADKVPYQSYLIDSLSSSLADLPLPLAVDYFSVFCLTMRREWSGIDALRLDKFYLLIRRFLHFFFVFLRKNCWDLGVSGRMMGVLMRGTFLADDRFRGNGVNYHVASIFLEELRVFLPVSEQVLKVVFGPLVSMMAAVDDKVLLGKLKSNVFDELLKMGKQLLEVCKSGGIVDFRDDVGRVGSIALALGFSSNLYELGSSDECHQGNRKLIFGLHEEFLKLEKDLTSSGINISIPEVNDNGNDDEVPNLIPIVNELEVINSNGDVAGGSASKHLRKCKKSKMPSDGHSKKANKKKKKNDVADSKTENCKMHEERESMDLQNGETASEEISTGDANLVTFSDSVISNLQMQFEKVADEVILDNDKSTICLTKKRKRAKTTPKQQSENPGLTVQEDVDGGIASKSGEKSAKRVKFSMKSNLVWKPHSPLPPQSLRLPPAATPRGSALKKGIPAGPIREIRAAKKKVKIAKQRAKSGKKGRKVTNGIFPAIKRVKKLKSISI